MATSLKRIFGAGLLGLVVLASGPAMADYRGHYEHRGHGNYGHGDRGHGGRNMAWGVGGLVAGVMIAEALSNRQPVYSPAPAPVYVQPAQVVYSPPQPVYMPPPAPVVSYQPEVASNWYYCQRPQGYYPYVRECRTGWIAVQPTSY